MPHNAAMLNIVLHRPEIPPNTGNVIRLCANTGAHLHLIGPLGFELDDARLMRAGLDYHEYARLTVHADLAAFSASVNPRRIFVVSTRGTARYDSVCYAEDDAVVFGSETSGLPQALIESVPAGQRLRLPMRPQNRSLNLSNAVAVVAYEAWRQIGFEGGN
ncbi:tRNA (cytidine(34)-2'-O)-methyltransferase [Dokdonella sp.]|uniref:tRNA (cytidine(34)-2'-O)-methyltransferase n=1 Tax=Dokdonella sp. TaxID=2291710 RepID=UPI003C47DA14